LSRLNPEKLKVHYLPGVKPESTLFPRRYTLTHSDVTGDLYLTIGPDYNLKQINGLYNHLMRDEVLAEWRNSDDGPALHVHCHVSGGFVLGRASWRYKIFRREMPLVLQAIRYGDKTLLAANPELDQSRIWVHFHAPQPRYNKIERWGELVDYSARTM
jgi:hypothetical protein